MMTQVQAIGYDEQTIAQAELEQYIVQQADLGPFDNGQSLSFATQSILSHAHTLKAQKERDKTEYKQRINDLGWKGEEKRYLKVAAAFENFSPQDLANIEPATIFRLGTNSKKYSTVIDQLLDLPEITQAAVRELIEQQRKPREPKSENPTIWRQTPDGRRYCQIPPIHEENQQTGITLQHMMDEEGLTAQRIVAEALALRQAFIEGRLVAVESPTVLRSSVPTFVEPFVQYENLLTESYSAMSRQRLESVEAHPESAAEQIQVEELELQVVVLESGSSSQSDNAIAIPDLAAEQYSVEELESQSQSHSVTADSWTSEPEQELDLDTVEYSDYAQAFSPQENALTQASPTELLIHTFQTAAQWSEISSVLKIHSEYKQQAWDALTPLEKRRVMAITPPEIKKLNEAKKAGKIVDFREVREDVYQVQHHGCLFWEVVSKSRLDTFLAQL